MTPDQDNNDILTSWPSNQTDSIISPSNENANKYISKCHPTNTFGKKLEYHHPHHQQHHQHHQNQHHQCKEFKPKETEDQPS